MDLPKGWINCHLIDVNTVIAGQSPESKFYNKKGDGLPFFQGKADFGQLYPINRVYCTAPKKIAESGDILLSVRAPVGPTNLAKETIAIGRGLNAIRPLGGLLTRYTLYYFKQIEPVFSGEGTGTTFSAVTVDDVKNLVFPLPPLAEQHRIVEKIDALFSKLDKGVATLQTIRQQLRTYRQAVLKWAFEGKNTKFVCLYEIADIVGGITKGRDLSKHKTTYLPYLRVANVQDGYLDLKDVKEIEIRIDEKDKYLLQNGDVLYTEGGDKDKLGRGTIWKNEIKECVHQNHIFRARINSEKAIPKYIALFSLTESAKSYFFSKAKQTVNLASINMTVLRSLPIPLPSLREQHTITATLESRLSICDQLETIIGESLAKAETLRQSILKKAFSGQLVPQDPNDEPAVELLNRIKLLKPETVTIKPTKRKKNG